MRSTGAAPASSGQVREYACPVSKWAHTQVSGWRWVCVAAAHLPVEHVEVPRLEPLAHACLRGPLDLELGKLGLHAAQPLVLCCLVLAHVDEAVPLAPFELGRRRRLRLV